MFPLGEDKLLLKFLGRPLLEHQMQRAKEAGLNRFVLVANPHNRAEIERIAWGLTDVETEFVVQEESCGIGDAVQQAEHLLGKEVIVVNSNDVINGHAYTRLVQESRKGSAVAYILGYKVQEYFPGGYLVVDDEGDLNRIVEKPPKGQEPSDLVNILVHLHTDMGKFLEYVGNARSNNDDIYECGLDDMVGDGYKIKVIP